MISTFPFTARKLTGPRPPQNKNRRRRHHHQTPKLTQNIPPSQPRKLTGPPARLKTKTDDEHNSKADWPPFPFTARKLTGPRPPQNKNRRRRHHHQTPKLTQNIPPSQPRKLTGPPARLKTKTDDEHNSKADWPPFPFTARKLTGPRPPQNKNRRPPNSKADSKHSPFTAPEADWPSCSSQNKNRRRTQLQS